MRIYDVTHIIITIFIILFVITYISSFEKQKVIYFDNNGTTKIFEESLQLMDNIYKNYYGNASAVYNFGFKSKRLLEVCRDKLAKLLNCESCEIYFTSGATESNNIALRGIYNKYKEKGNHVITSSIEHPSVYETVKSLEGAEVTFLKVNRYGQIDLQDLEESINKGTILVTIIMGSNEIGTLQNVREIAKICQRHHIHFHCDMTQVVGKYKIDIRSLNVDSATGSGHKFHGPKASGFLYLKKGTYFESCISGGHQEKNIRSGTENIPGIVAMCYSLYLCYNKIDYGIDKRIKEMRDYIKFTLVSKIPKLIVNGHPTNSLYNTLSLIMPVDSRKLIQLLDKDGICVNTGSACSKGDTSKVLDAIGVCKEKQKGSLRISLGFLNTQKECQILVDRLIYHTYSLLQED